MKKITTTGELYEEYISNMNKIADIRYASAVLQWDQETYLPIKGAQLRGQQIATLSELSHEMFTSEGFYTLVKELSQREGLQAEQKKNVLLTLYDIEQQQKLSTALVREMSEAINTAFHQWINARKENNFRVFENSLEKLNSLIIQESELLGYEEHPYDAQLNKYDKGSTVKELDGIFSNIIPILSEFIANTAKGEPIDDSFLKLHYPHQLQWNLGIEILKKMGFDFEAGRQDLSEHPFTINFNRNDVRITTRINENDFSSMLWSCIHELGHALYEQGLPAAQYGLPLGEPASLSIHESQSRLWENQVGRSKEFITNFFPLFRQYFPAQFKTVTEEKFYKAINKIQPSLIRTEADEISYHIHIFIRYNIEKQLITKNLPVKEIPAYWNEQYRQLLNVIVPDDRQGCLQDVHWSHGSFGYFPTYSTGSFYAAQFYRKAEAEIPALKKLVKEGNFSVLLSWLRTNIHERGRKLESGELCKIVTGEALNNRFFHEYAMNKYHPIYQISI